MLYTSLCVSDCVGGQLSVKDRRIPYKFQKYIYEKNPTFFALW